MSVPFARPFVVVAVVLALGAGLTGCDDSTVTFTPSGSSPSAAAGSSTAPTVSVEGEPADGATVSAGADGAQVDAPGATVSAGADGAQVVAPGASVSAGPDGVSVDVDPAAGLAP
jgi:hypothetical protein